jgi:hypothetical protein
VNLPRWAQRASGLVVCPQGQGRDHLHRAQTDTATAEFRLLAKAAEAEAHMSFCPVGLWWCSLRERLGDRVTPLGQPLPGAEGTWLNACDGATRLGRC